MRTLTHAALEALLAQPSSPCLSLFQPTHRHHPDNRQDPIRYRNLVKTLGESLRRSHAAEEAEALLAPFDALAHDDAFWNHTLDGLAVFGAPHRFEAYVLQRPVAELAVVADSFHVKPVIRFLQSADRYQVLGVSGSTVRMFEGSRDALDEVALASGVPPRLAEALGTERTASHLAMRSLGPGKGRVYHGRGAAKDDLRDLERFFRAVDRGVHQGHSKPSGLPLLLAALREHQTAFREISRNPFLLPYAIDVNPDTIAADELRARAWAALAPAYATRMRALVEAFHEAESRGRGTRIVHDAAAAVAAGRVARLLIDADQQIPGRFDGATGRVTLAPLGEPDVDDVLDDLSARVLTAKGEVVVLPHAEMPTESGLAAIYRR